MMSDNAEKKHETVVLENHPMDGRMDIREDGIFGSMLTNGGEITSRWL